MSDAPAVENKESGGISFFNAVLLIINAEAGAGILNFPETFKRSGGVIWAVLLQFIFLCCTTGSLTVLNIVSAKYEAETLGELCFRAGGISLGMFSSIIISIYGMFGLTAYMVVVADNWDLTLFTLDKEGFCERVWYYNRTFTVLLSSLFIILPNCFPKNVGYLKYAARVGVFGIFYVTVLINFYWLLYDSQQGHVRVVPNSFLEFISALPTFCYAYHCHVQSVPIFHSLRNKTWEKILLVAILGNGFCFVLFSSVGVNGYLSFGDDVFENVIKNYDGSKPPVVIAIIFIVIKICCTYPVILFVTRKEVIWLFNFFTNGQPESKELIKRIICVLILFCISIVLGQLVETIGVAFGFSGTLIALYLFFFPGLLLFLSLRAERKEDNERLDRKKLCLAVVLMVMGVLQFSLSLGLTIRRLIVSKKTPPRNLCD